MKGSHERQKSYNRFINSCYKSFIIPILLLSSLIYPTRTTGQQQQTIYCFTYYKTIPGKEHELRSLVKAVDTKVQQERVNKGAISSWYLYEVLNPTGSSAEYDHVMITTASSFKNSLETPYTFDSAFRKTFPGKDSKFFLDYYTRQTEAWRLVKQEIYAGLAVADSSFPGGSQLKYIVTDFMQPKPEKGGQYVRTEVDTFRLIHRERVKLDDISQWAFLQLAFPFDARNSYSYLALNFYKDLDRMFGNAKYEEGLKKTFPNISLSELFQSASSARDNPRAEILRLGFYALPLRR